MPTPHLPAVAHRVRSAGIPTPEHMIHGHHPLHNAHQHDFHFAGGHNQHHDLEPHHYPYQIYGKVLPQGGFSGAQHRGHRQKFQIQGMVLPRGGYSGMDARTALIVAGARQKHIAGAQPTPARICPPCGPGKFPAYNKKSGCRCVDMSGAKRKNLSLATKKRRAVMAAKMKGYSGRAHTLTGRLRLGFAGADAPPGFPDYPGNAQRKAIMRRARKSLAGAAHPPDYPDYPGNAQRAARMARRAKGYAGAFGCTGCERGDPRHHHEEHDHEHGGACCESCEHGGPCEGCDGAGGCGKPNCGCMK